MKLDDIKVDVSKLENGEWVDNIPDMEGLRLKVRGINNTAYRRLQQRLVSTLPRKKRINQQIDIEDMDRITSTCLFECCLDGWDGITNGTGEPLPFTKEKAHELLFNPEWRAFRDAVLWAATFVVDQAREEREVIEKN